MKFIDAHCHLQDERIFSKLDQIMQKAYSAGVFAFLCCAAEEEDWEKIASISRRYHGVIALAGIHPYYIQRRTNNWEIRLREFLLKNPCAGIGETGLDYLIDNCALLEQKMILEKHFEIANELNRFVNIHCRKAWEVLIESLQKVGGIRRGVILHSYSGSAELIPVLYELGAYFSFSGSITRPNNKKGPLACKRVPTDRLLIETDSPDILPSDHSLRAMQNNEPANLVYVARRVSEVRGVSLEEIAEVTTKNAEKIVGSIP